jgi:hypothetical protein
MQSARVIEALPAERGSNGLAKPGTVGEGPNDWKWQVGLASHEWKAAENRGSTGLGAERSG